MSWPALIGWSAFALGIVWLAHSYAAFNREPPLAGVPEQTELAFQVVDFLVALSFTTPLIVTAVVCFGGARRDASPASAPAAGFKLVLSAARHAFRITVACAAIPCAFLVVFLGILDHSEESAAYGVPAGVVLGMLITSALLLGAGTIGAFVGGTVALLRHHNARAEPEQQR